MIEIFLFNEKAKHLPFLFQNTILYFENTANSELSAILKDEERVIKSTQIISDFRK